MTFVIRQSPYLLFIYTFKKGTGENKKDMKKNLANPLVKVNEFGQSIWLDFISRQILHNGELLQLIAEDGLHGMTSNPAIFEKAMAGSPEYDDDIRALVQQGKSAGEVYEAMAVTDVQHACDRFRSLYDDPESNRTDGYVSLEVAPTLVHDTQGTIEEGRRLWGAVNRPNLMIKVPGTVEGLPAVRTLIGEGINVNVTLLFSVERYRAVVDAYLGGLEDRAGRGESLEGITSVASFFLSRIDLLLDPQLEKLVSEGGAKAEIARPMVGQVAIANAKRAYQLYKETVASNRFQALASHKATMQRLLWASTGNKNPNSSPLKYLEALIGPKTVNTVPLDTLLMYRKDGQPQARLEEGVAEAERVLNQLPEVGIDLEAVATQLEVDGAKKFVDPFTKLMEGLEKKRQDFLAESTTAGR